MPNIFYINPHNGLYGGNKIVFEHCNHLAESFQKCFVVCDDAVPGWMDVDAHFLDRRTAAALARPDDIVIFHWDYDADYAIGLGARNVYYFIQSLTHLDTSIFKYPVRFIAVSSCVREHTRKNFNVEAELVMNAIDPAVFYPRPSIREKGRVFAIDRGGSKRVEDIRAAEKAVRKTCPDAHFVYRDNLSAEEMAVEYSKAEVFVSASLAEGFGLPVLEAMACGAAVVTTDAKGIDDFAFDGKNCFKVPTRDPGAIAEAIIRLLRETETRERFAEEGLVTASRFRWKNSIKRLRELFGLKGRVDDAELFKHFTDVKTITSLSDPASRPFGRPIIRKKTAWVRLKRFRGGARLLKLLKRIGVKEESVRGDFDYDKVGFVDREASVSRPNSGRGTRILYVPYQDPKLDFVVLGSEESCALTDFGYRTLIFAKALSHSKRVGQVLVVNCPVSLPRRTLDRLSGKKRIEDLYPLVWRRPGAALVRMDEKTHMLNLTALFPDTDGIFSKWNSQAHARSVSDAAKELGLKDFVLWISTPRMVGTASGIASRTKIFDAIDNQLTHPGMVRSYGEIREAYRWVDDQADLISIASEGQRKMFLNGKKIFLLPNGVDDLFLGEPESSLPADLKSIPRPVAGYVGVLQERLDVGLMCEVAKQLPEFSFVFVGPVKDPAYFEPLEKMKNVFFLGIKRYADIPKYVRSFDACILPHKLNAFTDSMNPLKMYEYLGCGRPVVSTPVAGADIFHQNIFLAKDAGAFAAAIQRAVSENSREKEIQRRQAASEHSVSRRVEGFIAKIQETRNQGGERA